MTNTLITYPRTGTQWTRNRLTTMGQEYGKLFGTVVKAWHAHANYHPNIYDYANASWRPKEGALKHFALIREARKVVVSNWHWLRVRGKPEVLTEYAGHPEYDTLEAYVPYGAPRYAHYLNWLGEFRPEAFYFYEDIGTEEFVRIEVPRILGIPHYEPDDRVVAKVMDRGAKRVNLVGANHDSVSEKLLAQIDELIREHVHFEPYLERYGVGR